MDFAGLSSAMAVSASKSGSASSSILCFLTLGKFRKATATFSLTQNSICHTWIQLLIASRLPVPRAQAVAVPAPRYTSAIKMRFLFNIDATDRQVPSMIPSTTRLPNRFSLFLTASVMLNNINSTKLPIQKLLLQHPVITEATSI